MLSIECSTALEEQKRIAFYGAGEVAEIGYVCLQDTDLHLVAVIDERRSRRFFGLPVSSPERLDGTTIDGKTYDRLVVMRFDGDGELMSKLRAHDVPSERVFWL